MSSGTIILLILLGLLMLSVICFYYGFKMGVRAERTNWDLRQMVKPSENSKEKPKGKPAKQPRLSDLEVIINEQLGFWQNESDEINSQFCENYMKTLQHLRLHVNRIKRESDKKWEKMKPIWKDMDFQRVSLNTCLTYELSRNRMIENLKKLLEAASSHSGILSWAN